MNKQAVIDLILEHGSVNQKYIIKRDIMCISKNSDEMKSLQNLIVESKPVQKVLKKQNSDGWIGFELHGGVGTAMDSSVGYLIEEMGIEPEQDFMQKAKQALLLNLNPDYIKRKEYDGFSRKYNFSKSVVLGYLYTGGELETLQMHAYSEIMEIFQIGKNVKSLDEVSKLCTDKKHIGHRVYLKGKTFPWPSDFIVLSCCLAWKTDENLKLVHECLNNIVSLLPIPVIFDHVGHYVAPICNYEDATITDCTEIPKGRIGFWLRDFNRLCKICDLEKVPYFYSKAIKLKEYIETDTFIQNLSDSALSVIQDWYGYNGKWKNDIQKKTDIYFRALLILHNAHINF